MLPVRRTSDTDAPRYRDPISEFDRMTRDLLPGADGWRTPIGDGVHSVLADLEETDDEFILDVDLPGVDKDDVDIELEGRRLTVTAERKERERTGILRRRTRTVGTYRHEVVLPTDVGDGDIDASLTDGVLTVRLPKQETGQRRHIAFR